jgi:hypothetical protein
MISRLQVDLLPISCNIDDEERHTVDCSINNKQYEKQRMERAIEDDIEV